MPGLLTSEYAYLDYKSIEPVLDFCAIKFYKLPLIAGFVFELKTPSSF